MGKEIPTESAAEAMKKRILEAMDMVSRLNGTPATVEVYNSLEAVIIRYNDFYFNQK